jgi:hypothetical protein
LVRFVDADLKRSVFTLWPLYGSHRCGSLSPETLLAGS